MRGSNTWEYAAKQAYNQALKQYCKLDTLAMVVIWQHWQNLVQAKQQITSREEIVHALEK